MNKKSTKAKAAPKNTTASRNRRRKPAKPGLRQRVAERCRRVGQGAHHVWVSTERGRRIAVQLCCVGGLAVLTAFAGHHLRQYATQSDAFRIRTLTVDGTKELSRAQVLSAAGVDTNQNIFEISASTIQKRLEKEPWISEAKVTRSLPDEVRIEVVERKAALLVALDALYLVSDAHEAFKAVASDDEIDLPTLTGADKERFLTDGAYRLRTLEDALALVEDYRAAGLWSAQPLQEIHMEPDGSVSLHVGADGTEVRLGHPPYRNKLRRLTRVFKRLDNDGTRASYVFADHTNRPERVTVRLHQESGERLSSSDF